MLTFKNNKYHVIFCITELTSVGWAIGPTCKVYRLPGGHSEWVPPDTIPNSEVKTLSADDSVGFPCESRTLPGFLLKTPWSIDPGVFFRRGAWRAPIKQP